MLPNILTLSRIAFIPIIIACFYISTSFSMYSAFVVFVVACITDFLDGYFARLYKQMSNFGKCFDPIADKLLVASLIVLLTGFQYVEGYNMIAAIIILFREVLVSGMREFLVEIFDTLAAILSAVIIIPAVFAANIPPTSGPGLTFISLPIVFQQLSGGQIWSISFYLLLALATVTSTISIFEALTNLFMDKLKLKRFTAVLMVMLITCLGFTAVTASFSGIWDIKILDKNIFELFDWLSSTFTAAIVSMTIALFVGYSAMKTIIHNIRRSAVVTSRFTRYFLLTLRIFAPLSLGLLLFLALYNTFSVYLFQN